jgi:hypothetical protein
MKPGVSSGNLYNPHPVLIDPSPHPFYLDVEGRHPLSLVIPVFLTICVGILFLWILNPQIRLRTC